jgi:hypothetical protein
MPLKRFGVERPDFSGLAEDDQQYIALVEAMAASPRVHEDENSLDPRTWPLSTYITMFALVATLLGWAWSSGGEWKQLESRVNVIETKESQDAATYARRDLLEQQMNYVVTGLNELKVKVDQLSATTSKR